MNLEEFKSKQSGLIDKVRIHPQIILIMPFHMMIEFIIGIFIIEEEELFKTLVSVAISRYGYKTVDKTINDHLEMIAKNKRTHSLSELEKMDNETINFKVSLN